jgi:hypothetical protein
VTTTARRLANLVAIAAMFASASCAGSRPAASPAVTPSGSAGSPTQSPDAANPADLGPVATTSGENGPTDAPATGSYPAVTAQGDGLPEAIAILDSACVRAGDTVTITVDTGKPYAGVVYLAYYARGKNGAPVPYGDGYGGNSGGPSDEGGVYTDTWPVRADTPAGPARVDLNIVYNGRGDKRAMSLPFTVTGVSDTEPGASC